MLGRPCSTPYYTGILAFPTAQTGTLGYRVGMADRSYTHARPSASALDLPLWKRLNLICLAFGLSNDRLHEITAVSVATLGEFRRGICRASVVELELIRLFVREVERRSDDTLWRFAQEFAPVELAQA